MLPEKLKPCTEDSRGQAGTVAGPHEADLLSSQSLPKLMGKGHCSSPVCTLCDGDLRCGGHVQISYSIYESLWSVFIICTSPINVRCEKTEVNVCSLIFSLSEADPSYAALHLEE